MQAAAINRFVIARRLLICRATRSLAWGVLIWVAGVLPICITAQSEFDGRRIESVRVDILDSKGSANNADPYSVIAEKMKGEAYSAAAVRDAVQALYKTRTAGSIETTAARLQSGGVEIVFRIRRKPILDRITLIIDKYQGEPVTEQELLFKLNLVSRDEPVSSQMLGNSADQILDYLRERGFLASEIATELKPLPAEGTVEAIFRVSPGDQAKVGSFDIRLDGLETQIPPKSISLKPEAYFSRQRLNRDLQSIRSVLRDRGFLAPRIDDVKVTYDSDANRVNIELRGERGPTVEVKVTSDREKVSKALQNKLLPIRREGTLDFAAIVEGERRLENHFQELGYFFVDVTPVCSADPPISDGDQGTLPNDTEFLCSNLSSSEIGTSNVTVDYRVRLRRKLRLSSIRIRGTDKLTIDEIRSVVQSQEANVLGVLPLFGYGRGVTSLALLEEDAETIRSLMNELGYRQAAVRVNQGVSPTGDDLVITFEVDEGPLTTVDAIRVSGNSAVASDELLEEINSLNGAPYSRAKVRNAVRKLTAFYAERGYFDARVTSEVIEDDPPAGSSSRQVKVEFRIENEGGPVTIGRVLVTGNELTRDSAIERASVLKPGDLLRAVDIYSTEQNLYGTDAFERVDVKLQPAGTAPSGQQQRDVIINVAEQPPRLIQYGGGYSTDVGVNGFFDLRHVNLLGRLWQGGARVRVSTRQQLFQFDFVNPRFLRDGVRGFAPLTLSAQYQRDSTVTRFFRSAFDKGTFGIVQRLDAQGSPIDEFGNKTGSPTINRLTLSAETSRTLSVRNRSLIYAKFKFEDVRLFNIESLLVKDLLRPDSRIRTSGFSFTYVRDTRKNCSPRYTLLETIAKGEPGEKCRYNATDPTKGSYITAEYSISVPGLGANIGFQKLQASYNFYYTFPRLKRATVAGRAILGLGQVFSNSDRFSSAQFPGLNGILPISERFFAGGSTTLRGFDFEEAGPRAVIVPQGTFLNSSGQQVTLDPFTLPFGGNALAIVNLEARLPISRSLRAVPFYDGGNVFRRAGDIFNPPNANTSFEKNLRALWSHTVGLGFRLRTPVGGELGVDIGYLINPPRFLIPQINNPDAIYKLRQTQIHFRFSQAF
ncbi:MAG: BamA/TamA family outer membrane protein [Pyrinomonadaceae bacterium]|nr:BamA/TamA family outer membrane protein [Pyrinomonadaceae bacterium]